MRALTAGPLLRWNAERLRVPGRTLLNLTDLRPEYLFSDVEGLTPIADWGAGVAAIRDRRGHLVATQETSGDRPRAMRHPAGGVRNRLPNNSIDGAVAGPLDGAGSLPDNWFIVNVPTSAVEVLLVDTKGGLPRIRLRINGTPTGNIVIGYVAAANSPAASSGQTWTASIYYQMVAGSTTNISAANVQVTGINASNATVEISGTNFFADIASNIRRAHTRTLNNADTVRSRISTVLTHAGGAVDITLDIQVPQHEQSSAATDVQLTRADGFDVTEPGQRNLAALSLTGGRWAALADALTLGPEYTVAAAARHAAGPGTILGAEATADRQLLATATGAEIRADGSSDRRIWSGLGDAATALHLWQVGAASAGYRRNGTDQGAAGTADGAVSPFGAVDALGKAGSDGFDGLIYGALAFAGAPLSETERRLLELSLMTAAGVGDGYA